ncbi:MAG TPA: hypothetical protein VH639_08315 [Bryobacteraceae bacterium]|jgi:hypothetical protein
MTRIVLSLEERETSWLKRRSESTGESMAEIVRRAVRKLKESEDELEELLEATKGIWRKGDGLEYQREIREEWDERTDGFGPDEPLY